MTTSIGVAGSPLNIRLGQTPGIKDPALNNEFQLIFNALHLLSAYMGILRENLESSPGQDPSESVRFRRTFWAPALDTITVGAICSSLGTGIILGVGVSQPFASFADGAIMLGSTSDRRSTGSVPEQFFIALTAAAPGELVQVGVGPGVLKLSTAKCGQLIWGVGAISVNSWRNTGSGDVQYTVPGTRVGNGGLYLANVTGHYYFPSGGGYNWEGYYLPGFPNNPADGSGTAYYNRAFLYPIGVCISDGFVIFSDYKRSDPLPTAFS